MPLVPARRVAAALALVAVTALGATSCAQPETIRSYTPANGANADAGSMKARGLALVTSGGPALLAGALTSDSGDRLASVSANAIAPTLEAGEQLAVTGGKVTLPAGTLVALPAQGILVTGPGLQPGLTARVVLTFEKAGSMSVVVPVVSTDHPDWAHITPKPGDVAKSAAPTPTPTPSVVPSAAPATGTPDIATPTPSASASS